MENKRETLEIGRILSELVRKQHRDIVSLAKATNISRAEIYNILKNRPKYSLIYKLRSLAEVLGITLTELIALAEGRIENQCAIGDERTEYTYEFKKYGFTLIGDTPPRAEIFSGRLILSPGAEGIGGSCNLFRDCRTVHMRMISGNAVMIFGGKERQLKVSEKVTFNPRLPYLIRNSSRVARATLALATSPGLNTQFGPEGDTFHHI
ncbi:MAG: helix-turn-helix transcriptional regulator [Candidatus Omnitrophica bacterium]|nr:helix-turn-helix transcriptional regulator [Candidatus Omnitrophota bacterium]